MHIKFLSNGMEQHVSGEVGRGFITAGLAEEVKKVAVPIVPLWSVILDESGYVAVKMELGTLGPGALVTSAASSSVDRKLISATVSTPRTVAFYHGDPDSIHDRKDWRGQVYCSAFGRPVPKEIIDQYRKARKNPKACAPAIPLRLIHHTGNDTHRAEMEFRNQPEKLFKPVVPEHEALAVEEESNQIPPIVIEALN
jgi:hypothetical protein